jgi:hypothetical protein
VLQIARVLRIYIAALRRECLPLVAQFGDLLLVVRTLRGSGFVNDNWSLPGGSAAHGMFSFCGHVVEEPSDDWQCQVPLCLSFPLHTSHQSTWHAKSNGK